MHAKQRKATYSNAIGIDGHTCGDRVRRMGWDGMGCLTGPCISFTAFGGGVAVLE